MQADDLKNMNPDDMGKAFGGDQSARKPKKQTRSQYKRRLIAFYTDHGLDDKVAGADAALDKWKGREEKMFVALRKKYKDEVDNKHSQVSF